MDVEIRHLKLLAYVAQERSLTKAARHLHVTQPALSHQLKDLEAYLGTPVFHRVGKSMQLTAAGRRLLRTAEQVLASLQEAEDDVRRIASGQRGSIRISTECYTCYHWLPPVIQTFHQEHPGVTVDINAAVTRQPIAALLDGHLDLAVVSGPVDNARLEVAPLFEDEKVALMRPDHPLADRTYLAPKDFACEHLIVYDTESSSVLHEFLYPSGVQPRRVSEVQITEGILELVKAGLGVTILAHWAAFPDVEAGKLAAVRVTEAGLHRQWKAVTLAEARPPYLECFIELLARHSMATLRTD